MSAPVPALAASLAGVAAAAWLSWPDTLRPNTHTRDLGRRIAIEVAIDPFADPGSLGTYSALVKAAFDPVGKNADLDGHFVPESTAAFIYATRPKPLGTVADYVMRAASVPLSGGEEVVGAPVDGVVLVARDPAILARDRAATDEPVSIAPAFRVPRETIFGRGLHDKTRLIWDLARITGLR